MRLYFHCNGITAKQQICRNDKETPSQIYNEMVFRFSFIWFYMLLQLFPWGF